MSEDKVIHVSFPTHDKPAIEDTPYALLLADMLEIDMIHGFEAIVIVGLAKNNTAVTKAIVSNGVNFATLLGMLEMSKHNLMDWYDENNGQ